MAIQYFPAIVEAGDSPGFGVFFPDLPGCVAVGDTVNEAILNAEQVLALHLRGMAEDGDPIPAQRDFADIEHDPDVVEVARVLVRADLPGKAVRFNATMDEGLLSRVDAAAGAQGMSRSGFISEAARKMLDLQIRTRSN